MTQPLGTPVGDNCPLQAPLGGLILTPGHLEGILLASGCPCEEIQVSGLNGSVAVKVIVSSVCKVRTPDIKEL